MKRKKAFVAALTTVAVVSVVLGLSCALTEVCGLETKKLVSPIQLVVLAVFSAGLLVWRLVRYRETSRDIEKLREEIERNTRTRV